MKARIISVVFLIITLLSFSTCSLSNKNDSTFSIQFIDVGQGDAALVECDGHYMLIDGGDTSAGDKVYSVLEEN
ncbi:MAG: MBL fold metallo-hydrolase, partial [Oscillospiraceae bacterium]